MIKKNTLALFGFLLVAFAILNFSDGPAGGGGGTPRMQDRTGSPFADGNTNCSACHNSGSFESSISIHLLLGEDTVTQYVAGTEYSLRYTIEAANGEPSAYGFQSVVLTTEGDANAGTFGEVPTGTRVATIDTRNYVEHTTSSTSNVFEIPWTAPEQNSGSITIYAGGNAANGNGGTSGDNGVGGTLEITELVSSTDQIAAKEVSITAFPNPAKNYLNLSIENDRNGFYQLEIIDLSGKILLSKFVELNTGFNNQELDVNQFPVGMYNVRLFNGKDFKQTTFMKG